MYGQIMAPIIWVFSVLSVEKNWIQNKSQWNKVLKKKGLKKIKRKFTTNNSFVLDKGKKEEKNKQGKNGK